jgi:hypothetical protein
MMMGYTLYPAMISVFLVVFTSTFDAIYYGFTAPTTTIDIGDLLAPNGVCYNNNSVYCTFLSVMNSATSGTVCDQWSGAAASSLVSPSNYSVLALIQFSFPQAQFIPNWSQILILLELLFLALLFNFLADSTMEFLGTLVNINGGPAGKAGGLGAAISGAADMAKDIKNTGSKALSAIKGGGGSKDGGGKDGGANRK